MDFVDFYPATEFGVIFVTEADLVAETNYKRNLAKLKKANFDRSAVLVEKTAISGQYFYNMQKFTVLELGLGIIPVTGIEECTQVLISMVRMGSEDKTIFRMKGRVPPLETYLLKTLLAVPSLGETKSQAILLKFKSLRGICNASEEDLAKVIGPSSAKQVYNFFHNC
ncbi:Fanconi anemia core complex-associated protein 24 isoform X2 [Parasteatoda tepidariorum]|nr:Fanconi anemia core complex-associated protein 24 isoform X2 [Parasteatoda tepidariorum]